MVCGLFADSLKLVPIDVRRWSANYLVQQWVLTLRGKQSATSSEVVAGYTYQLT